jgi:hypothetical protein
VPRRLGVPLAVLAVAGVWGGLASRLPLGGPDGPGEGLVPLLLAGLLGFLGLLLLAGGGRAEAAPGAGWGRAAVVLAFLALYIVALTRVGFLAATPVYVAIAVWQCGGRAPAGIAATALGITLGVWLVLARLFQVPLP